MNTKEVQTLESYFNTENEHWNGFAFKIICEVMQKANFTNPETPLQTFRKAVDIFTEHLETPLKAVQMFEIETNKRKLDTNQKLFLFEWVLKYVKLTEFKKTDKYEVSDIANLLKSRIERLKAELNNKPLVGDVRDTLKDLIREELEQLPETLKGLDPVQRLNILCKLMPYVLPKVESVSHTLGEPGAAKKGWFG